VVSINYRLGALGFLYLPDEPEASSNVGLLDMTSALRFVKDNIAQFGGDPGNVTIFGESAGGYAIAALLAIPSAKGLFNRAILQSGAAHPLGMNPEAAIQVHETLTNTLGVQKGDLKALRRISSEELIEAQTAIIPVSFTEDRPLRLGPVVDQQVLPEHPLEALKKGYAKETAVFAGSNLDETRLWNLLNPEAEKIDENGLRKGLKELMAMIGKEEQWGDKLLEIYRGDKKNPIHILNAITTDFTFRIPSIRLAEAQSLHQKNTYMYLFTWQSPFRGGKYGAMHALELGFVFGVLLGMEVGIFPKRDAVTERLSGTMMDTWIAFAKTGNPNNAGIPFFPPYDSEKRATLIFDKEVKVVDDPYRQERTVWDDLM
jgi:para-nitrobenzyl esterase